MYIKDQLKSAHSLVDSDDEGIYLRGEFVNYSHDLYVAVQSKNISHPKGGEISKNLYNIVHDLWNIGALITRLEWMVESCKRGFLSDARWSFFASLDIEHFHIQIRSIMDYAATCIGLAANKPGSIPTSSFRKLYQWLNSNPGNMKRLGSDLSKVIKNGNWFPSIRDVRDSTLHRGASTIIFGSPEEGVLFQVFESAFHHKVREKIVMYNENDVVDFRRYGALAIARLLCLLEDLAVALRNRIHADRIGIGHARMYNPGLEVYTKWSTDFQSIL